jgi:hypothetical protein
LEQFLMPMEERFWPEITSHTMTPWLESDAAIQAKNRFDTFMSTQYPANP